MTAENTRRAGVRKWPRRLLITAVCLAMVPVLVWVTALGYAWNDDRKARTTTTGPYVGTLESLRGHQIPAWYDDAKFGVFLHWGLFSVPGYAPVGRFNDLIKRDYDHTMTRSPYAEDYWNALRDPGSPTAKFHRETYGTMPYEGFKRKFEAELVHWNPAAWAKRFRAAGAKYVVLTAKYADGFALWPTKVANPRQPGWHTRRDVVGELAAAVRAEGLRFGIYYSGDVDWTFQRETMRTFGDYLYAHPGDDYAAYAEAQVRELIRRYRPDILWNDIGWPTGEKRLLSMFADYYNTVPGGVVNDRWQTHSFGTRLAGTPAGRWLFDAIMRQAVADNPDVISGLPQPIPHSDFTTPEYAQYGRTMPKKWEMTRGIGNSWGYNRAETESEYASFERTLLPSFQDAIAKNGNLLLNIGPIGGRGALPAAQLSRFDAFGNWLRINGKVVYATRPWSRAEASTTTGGKVKFTRSADTTNLLFVGRPTGKSIRLTDVHLPTGNATLTQDQTPVTITTVGADTILTFTNPLNGSLAPTVVVPR